MSIQQLEVPPGEAVTDLGEGTLPKPEREPTSLTSVTACFLATAAAAWTVGGLFGGVLPRIVALTAALLGCSIDVVAQRTKRPGFVQAVGIPVVMGIATLAALVPAGGSPISAVRESIKGGGPAGELLTFDAGWRAILVLLIASLAAAACSLASSTQRPRLGVLVPVPALIGASLVQPKGSTLTSGIPAMMLLLGALVVSYGVELTRSGASDSRFEFRRIARGVVVIAGVAAMLVGVSHAGVLFPVPEEERVIPPRLPPNVPPTPDRVLFTVRTKHPGPWRLGVLDVYDGTAWRLPSYDPARLRVVPTDGTIAPETRAPIEVNFVIAEMSGPVLPAVAGTHRIRPTNGALFDPRTGVLRLPSGRSTNGLTYTITTAAVPSGKDLAASPPSSSMAAFLAAPAAPPQVGLLLADAPKAPLWDRLQYARTAFYRKVIASGAGTPKAVPPARVDEILRGKPASPFEIAAAEALIARWAGIPSRIGYGFFRGDARNGALEVHPRHAATWLEVYFEGNGWVPVVGIPPRAQASLNREDQQQNPEIHPTEQLALVLYVPIEQRSIKLFYVLARYWLAVSAPFVSGTLALIAFYPGLFKAWRRRKRRRWARTPRARIAVAYAELRDAATDLGIGHPTQTPMDFARAIADDDETRELSWLVSRALWGDLTRDLRDEDAEIAERLARSVAKRLRGAQPATTRALAIAARASLRDPYTREIPNAWPKRPKMVRMLPFGAALLAIAVLGSCGSSQAPGTRGGSLPSRIVPLGFDDVSFHREPSVEKRLREAGTDALIDRARVFTFRDRSAVQGYLQVGSFRPGISGSRQEVRRGVLEGIGAARFKLTRVGALRVYAATIGRQNFALWFAPEGDYFELLVQRASFGDNLDLLARILGYQGRTVGARRGGTIQPLPDPRRGESTV